MKASFTLSKIDDIHLKKYNIILKNYKKKIKNIAEILLGLKEIQKSEVFKENITRLRFDISFCNNETIHQINRDYRKKNSPTDVITFSLFYDDNVKLIHRKTADLGQIIVSIEKADEQKTKTLEDEILTLITHGILHLLGFDHLDKKGYDFVVNIQNTVMGKLNE